VPRWNNAPQAQSRVSNINFGIWRKIVERAGFFKYPMKNISRTQSSCSLGIQIKGIVRVINLLKCLGEMMHLKPIVGCHISTLIFEKKIVERGVSINITWKIYQGPSSSCPLGVWFKGIALVFNWLKCLGRIMHLKPTSECQISTLIYGFWRGDLIHIPYKITEGRQRSLPLGV
jgi:hypothetical protein